MSVKTPVTTAVGRLIGGSVTQLQAVVDNKGAPKLGKDGQPRQQIYFSLAIPKGGEQHWAHTPWGAEIWKVGSTAYPGPSQTPAFAWKIVDGDSPALDKKGKPHNQKPHHPGNWVIKFSSGFAPQIYRRNAQGAFEVVVEPGFLKLGHFVQVACNVSGNDSADTPGVYVNPTMVCFAAYGEEIFVGPDVASAGFGAAALPAGASAVPLGASVMPAMPGGAPGMMPPPGAPGMVYAPPGGMPPPAAPAMMPPPAAPVLMPVPGAAYTIDQCRQGGYTDDQIVAAGYATRMVAPAPAAALPPPLPPASFAPAPGAPGAPGAPAGVIPNPNFAQIPPAAAVPAGPQLTPAGAALAGPAGYAGFIAQGWTDAAMRAQGYLV